MIKECLLYPAMLDLKNRECVIFGGGKVAERKLHGILNCGVNITIVSPALSDELQVLYSNKSFVWIKAEYEERYLDNSYICFACTNSKIVNEKIALDAQKRNILINVVDASGISSFVVPSVRRKEEVVLSVYSNENPGASRYLADFLTNEIEDWQLEYISFVKDIREQCKGIINASEVRQGFIKKLYSDEYLIRAKTDIEALKIDIKIELENIKLGGVNHFNEQNTNRNKRKQAGSTADRACHRSTEKHKA